MPEKKDHTGSGSAIAGVGATTAGAGLLGGGIPGVKSNSSTIANIKQGSTAQRAGAAASSLRGGVFGYRTDAHKGFLQRQVNDDKYFRGADPNPNRLDSFRRGVGSGKIQPEKDIIRHMKTGRRLSNAALVGGAGVAAYGVHRAKGSEKVKKREGDYKGRDTAQGASGALLGAGGTVGAGGYGAARFMERQGRKWNASAAKDLDAAQKIIPNLKGHRTSDHRLQTPNSRVPATVPQVQTRRVTGGHTKEGKEIKPDPRLLAGKSKAQADAAGRLRGSAGQGQYFGAVYGKTAMYARKAAKPGMKVAGVGAAGLAADQGVQAWKRHQDKVHKSERIMSDAEIKRRKRVQGHVSQATGALGLTAFGGALAATKPGRQALRKIPKLRPHVAEYKPNPDKVSGITTPALATGGGLGALGSFNFASYTGAESRKRTPPVEKPVKKSLEPGIDMGYFGEEGHPVELPPIEVPIEKAWSPSASNYDSEKSRGKRNEAYGGAALGAAGAGAAYGGIHGTKTVQAARKVKPITDAAKISIVDTPRQRTNKKTKKVTNYYEKVPTAGKHFTALDTEALKPLKHHGKRAAIGAGVAAAGVGAHQAIKRKHESNWSPYAKRDAVSAFGIDHAH